MPSFAKLTAAALALAGLSLIFASLADAGLRLQVRRLASGHTARSLDVSDGAAISVVYILGPGAPRPTQEENYIDAFGIEWNRYRKFQSAPEAYVFRVSYWPMATLLSFSAFLCWWRVSKAKGAAFKGRCRCGYDLRAHKPGEKCPECGTVIPEKPAATEAPGGGVTG